MDELMNFQGKKNIIIAFSHNYAVFWLNDKILICMASLKPISEHILILVNNKCEKKKSCLNGFDLKYWYSSQQKPRVRSS